MEISYFMDKAVMPGNAELETALGERYLLWEEIRKRVLQEYPAGKEEWNFPGKKYGWSFRISSKESYLPHGFMQRVEGYEFQFRIRNL